MTFWEVEDTFFGAILGAFVGTIIDILPAEYLVLIIFFIMLFPMSMRKAEQISRHALLLVMILNILWMWLFVYALNDSAIMTLDKGFILLLIFLGWLVSISARSIFQMK
jgi:hypothetical protein